MKKVIEEVLEYTGLNANQLSDRLGLQRPQAIYDMMSGKTKNVSAAMKDKIISAFPELNPGWLMSGEGDMLLGGAAKKTDTKENCTVPLLPIAARGGSLNDFVVSVKACDCEKVVSPVGGVDFVMSWTGHSNYSSMKPYIAIADRQKAEEMRRFDRKRGEDGSHDINNI